MQAAKKVRCSLIPCQLRLSESAWSCPRSLSTGRDQEKVGFELCENCRHVQAMSSQDPFVGPLYVSIGGF